MSKARIIFFLILTLTYTSTKACKYTIREIGFSTLSKVTYVIYRVNEKSSFFPNQLEQNFSESNIKGFGLGLMEDEANPIVRFAIDQKLTLPAYVLAAPDGRMIALAGNSIENSTLYSPVRNQLVLELPEIYATVLLVEGKNGLENQLAQEKVEKTCDRVLNIMPNMPKQVEKGPKMIVISGDEFEQEKVLLWSLGLNTMPDHPTAFVIYGKGRIMGERVDYQNINNDQVYKLLSIIGADCECGLDRKWMLGYQIPLNWPKETRQNLSDILGFDVDNPMVLTEMSRILAIENRVAVDPDGISFEPVVIDLDKEFGDVPEIAHKGDPQTQEESIDTGMMMIYSFIFVVILIIAGAFFVLRRRSN